MSWGQELWDQYENISYHTHKGIEFLDKYGSFIKERCAIEIEYASKLRRLVKNHQVKKKDEDDNQFSYIKAFIMMLQEITDLAGQHEVIAENMMASIVKEIAMLVKELKDERKRHLSEGHKHQTALHGCLTSLDKAKRSYEKAFREAEKAQENFKKVDADLNLSRAEVEKARMYSVTKNQLCEDSKTEYANQLQKANLLKRQHYHELMPKVFQQLQDMEERRIACVHKYVKQSAVIHRNVFPIIDKCLEGIIKAADSIDPQQDCKLVIERYKSGNEPPDDIPFEDLSNPQPNNDSHSQHSINHSLHYSNSISLKSDTIRGTLSGAKFRKRGGIFAIFTSNKNLHGESKEENYYADLPPIQRKKKIQQKIDSIQAQMNQESAVRDGLIKMKIAYEQNPALGDPLTIEGQLSENNQRLEKLQAELKRFKVYLAEFNGRTCSSSSSSSIKSSPNNLRAKINRGSLSEDSLSRSASDSSVGHKKEEHSKLNHNHVNPSDEQPNRDRSSFTQNSDNEPPVDDLENDTSDIDRANNKIEGETKTLSAMGADFIHANAEDIDEVDYEAELLPSIGTGKVLYPFEAQSEGSIAMAEGEIFDVVEADQGDGWTRVRRLDCLEEGFVPTSYLQLEIFSNK